MQSRVRWHDSHCTKPRIIVDNGVPECDNCHSDSLVLVSRLVAENKAIGGVIKLPVEAPLGEADFWWPPSVPYSSPRVETRTKSEPCNAAKGTQILPPKDTQLSFVSTIYSSSLDSSRLRLIYLTESEDASSPIHIELEEYALNDSPEYETVSYVWGGENGDSTACKPIYVGPFWDVFLVTSNCLALLHYLRPRKGCRVIWLDAICIDQANNVEKSAQISIMRDIYVNCERVIVYFGEDLVQQPPGRLYRSRIEFEKMIVADVSKTAMEKSEEFFMTCAKSAGISQDQLLGRRYLTRIWIVQELVLSRKAVFPLGDSDILCDGDVAAHLVLRPKGQQLAASDVRGSLSVLLKATSHCDSSDPRDRVYGLLGLFRPRDVSCSLVSDYTLPWRDCWVGIGGYIVLVEKNIALLVYAVGANCPLQLPSWVPDIRTARSWLIDLPTAILHRDFRVSEDDAEIWATKVVIYSKIEMEKGRKKPLLEYPARISWGPASHRSVEVHSDVLCSLSLDQASVDSSNGGLELRALRVFVHPCRLMTVTEENGFTSVWFRGPSTAAGFRILGLNHSLDHDKSYHVFIISDQPWLSGNVLLAMTTALSGENHSVVKLDGCCITYDIRFYSMAHHEAKQNWTCSKIKIIHSLHWLLEKFPPLPITSHMWKSGTHRNWIFHCIFPSDNTTARDLLPLLMHVTELDEYFRELPPALVESISRTAERFCPDFDPFIRHEYYYLTIKNKEMFSRWKDYREVTSSWSGILMQHLSVQEGVSSMFEPQEVWEDVYVTTRYQGDDEKSNDDFWNGSAFPFTVRIHLGSLVKYVQDSELLLWICYAREFSSILDLDLETLLARSPTHEDRDVFHRDWDRELVEELGLVWKPEKIIIM